MSRPCMTEGWVSRSRSPTAPVAPRSWHSLPCWRGSARSIPRQPALGDLAAPVLRNHAGRTVGRIEPAPGWPSLGSSPAETAGTRA